MEPTMQITIRLKYSLIEDLKKAAKLHGKDKIQTIIYMILDHWRKNGFDHPTFNNPNPEAIIKLFEDNNEEFRIYDPDSHTLKPIDDINFENDCIVIKSKKLAS